MRGGWIFATAWAVGTMLSIFVGRQFKTVERNGDDLVISGYRETLTVPFSEVKDVTQSVLMRPQMVTIELNCETKFGRKIRFAVPGWPRFSSKHPVTEELESLSAAAQLIA
jgi:hypothetical protein